MFQILNRVHMKNTFIFGMIAVVIDRKALTTINNKVSFVLDSCGYNDFLRESIDHFNDLIDSMFLVKKTVP